MTCLPEAVVTDGVQVSRQYDLDFRTENQSMRYAGDAPTGEDKDEFMHMTLLKRSDTGFAADLNIDEIIEFCLFSKLSSMLSGIDLHGISSSRVINKLKDWFSNRCYKFGADFDTSVAGDFGLSVFGSYAGGSVDLAYPVSIAISYPEQNQINPGDIVEIKTSLTPRNGVNIVSHAPTAELGIYAAGSLDTDARANACLYRNCKSDKFWDLEVSGKRRIVLVDGPPGTTIDLSDPLLSTLVVNFEDLAGFTGRFTIPEIHITNEQLDSQLVLTGSDTHSFAQLDIFVDQWLLLGLGKLQKLAKKYFGVNKKKALKKVELIFNLLGITTSIEVIKHQDFRFDPDFSMKFTLSSIAEWEVFENGRAVDSGKSAAVRLTPGQSLRVKTTEDILPLGISPEVTLPNRFTNTERYRKLTYTNLVLLDVGLETPQFTVFGRRCVDFWIGSICTGRFKWSGFDLGFGPVVDENVWVGNDFLSHEFHGEWELKGFQAFPLQNFEVRANSAPVVTTPIADQRPQWNQVIDIDLDAHFDDPDGQALSYSMYGRPPFLQIVNGRLQGTVSESFSGEIIIRASDGYGGQGEDVFQLTVVMPLVDEQVLTLREATPSLPGTLDYRLSAQPSAPVTLRLTPDNAQIDLGAGAGAVAELAFDSSNWNTPQQLTVIALDDAVAERGSTSGISMEMQSADAVFQGGSAEKTRIYIRDNDRAGIFVSPGAVLTGEQPGANDNMNIRLSSQPVHPVTLSFSSTDATEFSVNPVTLNFDATNWNDLQVVTVSGVNDDVQDGTQEGQIQIAAASSDPFYEGMGRDINARNADDDQAGVTITPTVDLRTTEADEGSFDASFRVVLNSAPEAGGVVTVSLQSSNTNEGTLSPSSLVFDEATWDQPQTVTLTGVDDALEDGDQTFAIQTGISSVGSVSYAVLTDADIDDLSVVNIDDELSGLLIGATEPLQTGEDGTSASFSVRLRSKPEATVKVAIASSMGSEGEVDKGELLFTTENWGSVQQVILAGVDEDIVDGDQNYTVSLVTSSEDPLYAGIPEQIQARNQDNDVPTLVLSPNSGLEVTEMGGSDTFTVALGKKPASPVTVPIRFTSLVSTEAVVFPTTLSFTPDDWHRPQTVTVTGINDGEKDGDALFWVIAGPAASATPYDGIEGVVTATNYDADGAEILLTAQGSLDISENGGKALFSVQLNTMPLIDVAVEFSLTDGLQGSVSPERLVFTPENWNQPRIVTFTAQDNPAIDGLRAVGLSAQVPAGSGAGSAYQGVSSAAFTINLSDDDAAGILTTPEASLRTGESGGEARFDVVLLAQPTSNVTVPLQSSDPGEGDVNVSSLLFTSANWFVPQTVIVTGQDDVMADGDQDYVVQLLPAISDDANYHGLDAADVQASNLDDDEAGVTVSATELTVTEDGGSASFTVVLDTLPEGDVQLSLVVSNTEEAQLDLQTLTFTPANWNQPQQVVATGLDDDEVDGDQEFNINLSLRAAADHPSYGAISLPQIQVTNVDNDPVVVLVQEPDAGLTTDESGTEDRFSISLNAQPNENVYMEMRVDDVGEAMLVDDITDNAVASTTLIFTPEDWDQPREVMVRGIDDAIYDDDQVFNVIIQPTVSVDARFNGIDPVDPSGVNGDNDYNPMGYLYHAETGSLVHGGKVAMTCSNGVASVVSGRDGSEGFYQFAVTEINLQANCTLTYTPPAGYMLDDACPPAAGALDVPVADLPTSLGSSRDDASGKLLDKSCSANTWYQGFNIAVDAARIINNNLPLKRGACTYEPALLQVSGDFAGAGSTILSSAQEIQAADENSPVEVLAPHQLVLKAPRMMVKAGVVFRVEDGASLSVSPVVEYCQ
ncbi:Calx-beta domain-containing protein [Thiolapillus sp.]